MENFKSFKSFKAYVKKFWGLPNRRHKTKLA